MLALLVQVILLGYVRPATAGENEAWGRKVIRIRLQTDASLTLPQFEGDILQEVGKALDPAKVSDSLKRLYSTGRFYELRAETKSAPGGVELIFIGEARYFVGLVTIQGQPSSLDPRAMANSTMLRLGQPLTEHNLPQAVGHLKDVLAENGYYRAQVETQVHRNAGTQEAAITFLIKPGRPATLSKVVIEGRPVFHPARVIAVAGWHIGRHATASSVERGMFKIHRFYTKHGYLQVNALARHREYAATANTEELVLSIDAGPVVQVIVRGAKISRSELRNLLPVYTDGIVDDLSVSQGARSLQDHFQKQGYLWTSVQAGPAAHPEPNRIVITYSVKLGEEGEFEGYGFRGNHSVPDLELTSLLTLRQTGTFFEHPTFSRELLDENVRAIKALYDSRGYHDARIEPQLDDHYRGQPNHLFVTFDIQEGPRTTVSSLELRGPTAEEQKQLFPDLLNRPGAAYSRQNEQKDRLTILRFFADRGYAHVRFKSATSPVPAKHAVDVRYSIERGPKEIVQRILILGNEHTRPSTVQRELTLRRSQPTNESNILESQSKLYDLGIFNQVQIAPQNPDGSEPWKTMIVQLEEARRWTLGYGGGIEVQRLGSNEPQGQLKASPRVSLDVTRLNVGGRAQTASFRGRLSSLDRRASLSYFVPRFPARRDLSLRFNALFDRSNDVLTFTAERAEVSVAVEKRYSPATLLAARYSFRHVLAFNLSNKVSPVDIPLFSRPARIGMFGLSYINDHRNDPANPTRGSYSLADMGVAWTTFGSMSNFLRFSGQNATYYRLGRHLIFARDTRFGVESPFGGLRSIRTTGPNGVPEIIQTHEIPLPERFFMGGSESHRGFSINQAGPRDPTRGFPIGGNALFLNTFELRIPLAEGRFGVVLFHDAGNIYSSIRRMRLFKVSQHSPTDFDYTVHAVGAGLRYRTPVGPLRLDFGYALNPPRFQVQTQTNGQTSVEVQRLSNFQFFIGIGQTF